MYGSSSETTASTAPAPTEEPAVVRPSELSAAEPPTDFNSRMSVTPVCRPPRSPRPNLRPRVGARVSGLNWTAAYRRVPQEEQAQE
jgi:hypothetical protein